MAWFDGQTKAPALTRGAQKISAAIARLDDDGQRRAIATVASLISGIRNMAAMPAEITDELWSVLLTIARKAAIGANSDVLFAELKAGCSPELIAIIEREAGA